MSDREEKTGKNDNGKKNKGGKRNKIVAIEMIILVLLIMSAVAIFIQRDKSVKEAAKIHNQKAKKTEQTPQAAQKENEIEEETDHQIIHRQFWIFWINIMQRQHFL